MNTAEDRRRHERYRHGNLSVTVKRSGLRGRFSKPRIAEWMDFSHRGIAFESRGKYTLADTLLLDFAISDKKEISISNVVASVRNIHKHPGRYRYGVEFDYQASDYMNSPEVKNILVDIEQLLKDIFHRISNDH